MTDRELLELAAKAAGVELEQYGDALYPKGQYCADSWSIATYYQRAKTWNPLTDDGDALRLAVNLGISFLPYPVYRPEKHSVIAKQRRVSDTMREPNPTESMELYNNDPYAATRRAIVRAAAEIGKEQV